MRMPSFAGGRSSSGREEAVHWAGVRLRAALEFTSPDGRIRTMTSAPARKELPPAYEPASVESRIYRMWEEGGYFQPRIDPNAKPYTVIMPPPNVTGELHLGHGLEDSITDALVRWHRMQGDPTLWLPGEDHAGIA